MITVNDIVQSNRPPIANAGPDQTITLPANSVNLDGSASSDPDNNIVSYLWTKISGPGSFTIANDTAVQTQVSNFVEAVYQFELKVTDAGGLSAKDTVQLTVSNNNNSCPQTNHPPVANAGADITIIQPSTFAYLDASGSTDPDNNILSYEWTKISGPGSFTIANDTAAQTQVSNFVEGIYQFQLKVTDSCGLVGKDTVTIFVNSAPATQKTENLFFYFPDPTATLEYNGMYSFAPPVNLIKIKITNYPDKIITGVWAINGRDPNCPMSNDYLVNEDDNYASFTIPPGTYSWTAESLVADLTRYPITTAFQQFMSTPHSTQGTITVNSGDTCIIQKIVFQ